VPGPGKRTFVERPLDASVSSLPERTDGPTNWIILWTNWSRSPAQPVMCPRNGTLGEIERRMNEELALRMIVSERSPDRRVFFGMLTGFVAEPHRGSKHRLSLNPSDNGGYQAVLGG
jgi:hypothetical protein